MAQLRREIQDFPRDKDGGYIQPDHNSPQLEVEMNHNRMRYANQFNLADLWGFGSPHNYDETGDNTCRGCNQLEDGDCELIEDITPEEITPKASSCRHYEIICAGDPEMRLKRTTKAAALFGTAKNGEGFGCKRCPWHRESKWKDSLGRNMWCSNGYFTTEPNVCCALNSAPTIEEEDKEQNDDDGGSSLDKYVRLQRRA